MRLLRSDTGILPPPLFDMAAVGIVVALALPLFFVKLGGAGLVDPDEPYYAVPALEMLKSGRWLVPIFRDRPWFDKPVLFYWMILAAFKTFGVSEWAARVGSAVSGLSGTLARIDPATGKPDPVRTADFLVHHPETRAFMEWMRDAPLPSSFANGTYYSINAFRFTNAAGQTRLVRWSLVPETPFTALDKSTLASQPPDFLFDDVVQRLRQGPLRWHMIVTVAAPGDPVDDATKRWPDDRPQIDVGTLTIDRATTEEEGACRNITFDPLILPAGMASSDDPLLAARSAVYSVSLTRRDGEPAAPSAASKDPAIRGPGK
jgi:hypothetical protein